VISSGKECISTTRRRSSRSRWPTTRHKAAVLYCEPGGYYEKDANFTKPVVARVVGRWKSKLTRAVGHAGAMAGGNDDAQAKERGFMEKLGVDALSYAEEPAGVGEGRGGDQH